MAETTIRVIVDPSASPPPTAPDTRLTPPTSGVTGFDNQVSVNAIAAGGFALNTVRNVGTNLLGQVGALTGSSQKQRNINETLRLAGFASRIGIGAATGTLPLAIIDIAVELGTNAVNENIRLRNNNLDAQYKSTLRGNAFLGNR